MCVWGGGVVLGGGGGGVCGWLLSPAGLGATSPAPMAVPAVSLTATTVISKHLF